MDIPVCLQHLLEVVDALAKLRTEFIRLHFELLISLLLRDMYIQKLTRYNR
jgi:hypothetical protein